MTRADGQRFRRCASTCRWATAPSCRRQTSPSCVCTLPKRSTASERGTVLCVLTAFLCTASAPGAPTASRSVAIPRQSPLPHARGDGASAVCSASTATKRCASGQMHRPCPHLTVMPSYASTLTRTLTRCMCGTTAITHSSTTSAAKTGCWRLTTSNNERFGHLLYFYLLFNSNSTLHLLRCTQAPLICSVARAHEIDDGNTHHHAR